MSRIATGVLFVFILAIPGFGQEAKKPTRPANEMEVSFANGSVVKMVLKTPSVEIETAYGKLTVPINEIRQIEFGVHLSPETEAKVESAIANLNSEVFRVRELAGLELIKIGPDAFLAVHLAANRGELEGSRRAKQILQTLQQSLPAKDQRLQVDDQIITPKFTILGRIATRSVKAQADYFGEVELTITQLRTMRSTEAPGDLTVQVDAAKYASVGGTEWLATDFRLDGRSKLTITASGQVDLWPQGPGNYMSSPQGYNVGGGQLIIGGGINRRRINPGALMGRIGDSGAPFLVGENYEGAPSGEGKLFLQIGPSPWQNESSGSYQVKIAIRP